MATPWEETRGGVLMPFARQRIERLWYILFLARVVLFEEPQDELSKEIRW